LRAAGWCNFCGKRSQEVFGLAGIAERGVSICDECASLCLDIIGEDVRADQLRASPPVGSWTAPDDLDALLKNASELMEMNATEVADAIAEELEQGRVRRNSEPDGWRSRNMNLHCSFCDKSQREVAKLIAGPTVYVCDVCVGDVAAVLLGQRLRKG
jgi:ATP-dependent protease Clp ATPase subunit